MHEVGGKDALRSYPQLALQVNGSWRRPVDVLRCGGRVCEAWACKGSSRLMGLSLH